MSDNLLSRLVRLNNELTSLENQVDETREQRNDIIRALRAEKVTVRKISDVLGISEQSIHKIIKGQK